LISSISISFNKRNLKSSYFIFLVSITKVSYLTFS